MNRAYESHRLMQKLGNSQQKGSVEMPKDCKNKILCQPVTMQLLLPQTNQINQHDIKTAP
jgi:hypothetical protein